MNTQRWWWAAMVLGMLAGGCALGPKYVPPDLPSPETYRDEPEPVGAKTIANLPWWDVYQDATLKELIRGALTNNYDARIAVSRIEQARFAAAQSRALLLPSATYQYGLSHGQSEFLGSPSMAIAGIEDSSLASVGASWEADVWGRLRRQNEADRARLLASEEARNAVQMTLVGEVAQAYFNLLALDLQIDIARRTTNAFSQSLAIFSERLAGGVASKLEVQRAAAALANVNAAIPELERQVAVQENQLSLLLGENPGPIERTKKLQDQVLPPEVPAGIPSELLERRPDIRQAAANLQAANALIGASLGNLFPKFSLTAMAGSMSADLSAFSSDRQNTWGVGGSVSGPIFEGGRLVAQYHQAQAAWDEARIRYEQTVRNAFQEVASVLVTREKLARIRQQQEVAVQALSDSVTVSTERYMAGKAAYYEVLEAQQQLFPAENALAQTRLNELLVVVRLYKALGGGWDE